MAWMPKSEAADTLGLSPLVISRQIAVGRFRTKTVGGKLLVDVDIPHAPEVETIEQGLHRECETDDTPSGRAEPASGSEAPSVDLAAACSEDVAGDDIDDGRPLWDLKSEAELRDNEVYSAAIDAVQKVRAYCDRESRMARSEADQAWVSCDRAERRLRFVSFVAASMLFVGTGGVAWLDRVHQRDIQAWEARVAEVEVAAVQTTGRENGEVAGIRDAFAAFREKADAELTDLRRQQLEAQAALAASRVEIGHVCWERDEAMRDRDRLADEVASQRAHIEKMQSLQANAAARSLKELLDESWGLTHPPDTLPVAESVAGERKPELTSSR